MLCFFAPKTVRKAGKARQSYNETGTQPHFDDIDEEINFVVVLPLSSKEAVRQRLHHGRRTRRCPPTPQNEPRFLHNAVSVLPKFSFHFRKKKKKVLQLMKRRRLWKSRRDPSHPPVFTFLLNTLLLSRATQGTWEPRPDESGTKIKKGKRKRRQSGLFLPSEKQL